VDLARTLSAVTGICPLTAILTSSRPPFRSRIGDRKTGLSLSGAFSCIHGAVDRTPLN